MQPKKESLGGFVCYSDFLLLGPAKKNKARGTITVHLTSSSNVKVAFNFLNIWTLHLNPAMKDCHLVQAILVLSRQSWFKELDSCVSEKVKISLQKWCKEYHLEGKWDKETTSLPVWKESGSG